MTTRPRSNIPASKHASLRRVLLVEDNSADAELLALALDECTSTTFGIHHVTRMSRAVAYLADSPADVILLDLELPDASGVGAVQAMREAAPRVPIVVLTGQSDGKTGLLALERGAQDYIVKGWCEGSAVADRVLAAIARGRMMHELSSAVEDMRSVGVRLKKLGKGE